MSDVSNSGLEDLFGRVTAIESVLQYLCSALPPHQAETMVGLFQAHAAQMASISEKAPAFSASVQDSLNRFEQILSGLPPAPAPH